MTRVLNLLVDVELRRLWAIVVTALKSWAARLAAVGEDDPLERVSDAPPSLRLTVDVRRIEPGEKWLAFDVLSRHRALDARKFEVHLEAHERHGFELVGAFAGGELVGVLGMRPFDTFARGAHLHVDDIVVASHARGRGVTRQLIAFAERDAERRGLGGVYLDSKPEAVGLAPEGALSA